MRCNGVAIDVFTHINVSFRDPLIADVTGKFSTTAQFVDLIGQDLTLRMEEGKTINLKLDRLDDNGRAKASSRAYDMGRWKMQRAKLEKQLAQ